MPAPPFTMIYAFAQFRSPAVEHVIDLQASIFDIVESCLARNHTGFIIRDTALKPEAFCTGFDRIPRNIGAIFRPAENIHDVHFLTRLQDIVEMIEVRDCLLAEDRAAFGRDGNDPVAEALELLCDMVAGPRRIIRQANNSDDSCRTQQLFDLVDGWIYEHGVSSMSAALAAQSPGSLSPPRRLRLR